MNRTPLALKPHAQATGGRRQDPTGGARRLETPALRCLTAMGPGLKVLMLLAHPHTVVPVPTQTKKKKKTKHTKLQANKQASKHPPTHPHTHTHLHTYTYTHVRNTWPFMYLTDNIQTKLCKFVHLKSYILALALDPGRQAGRQAGR